MRVSAYVRACVCVRVCVRKCERDSERVNETETERATERERERARFVNIIVIPDYPLGYFLTGSWDQCLRGGEASCGRVVLRSILIHSRRGQNAGMPTIFLGHLAHN